MYTHLHYCLHESIATDTFVSALEYKVELMDTIPTIKQDDCVTK